MKTSKGIFFSHSVIFNRNKLFQPYGTSVTCFYPLCTRTQHLLSLVQIPFSLPANVNCYTGLCLYAAINSAVYVVKNVRSYQTGKNEVFPNYSVSNS